MFDENLLKNLIFRKYGVIVILIIFGFLGNYFSFPLFFGVDFLFGSIATFVILFLFGLWWGVVSAIIISIYTYYLWGHPYAIIIFTCEIIFVGFFLQKRKKSILLSVGLFWFFVGMPLVYLFYKIAMHMDIISTILIMLKQSINGFFNALIASLILNFAPFQNFIKSSEPTQKVSLREILFSLMVALFFLPVLVLMVIEARNYMDRIQNNVAQDLKSLSSDISMHMSQWFQLHMHGVAELATIADQTRMTSTGELQKATQITKKMFPDFYNMYVADAAGTTISFCPPINERGESTIGLNFADRNYFKELQTTHRPVVSKAFTGRGGVFSPIITLSAPILKDNRFIGFALGALDLTRILKIIKLYGNNGQYNLTLIDSENQVIASTVSGRDFMQFFDLTKFGTLKSYGGSLYQWIPSDKNLPAMICFKESFYVFEKIISDSLKWKLIIEYPIAPQRKYLYIHYIRYLLILLIFTIVTFLLAFIISKNLSKPLSELADITAMIPDNKKLLQENAKAFPESSITEIYSLVKNFETMTHTLEMSFSELHDKREGLEKSNEELQREINVRKQTGELLRVSEERMRVVIESSPIGIRINKNEGQLVYVNPALIKMFGYERADEMLDLPIENLFAPEDRELIKQSQRNQFNGKKTPFYSELAGIKKNGDRFDVKNYMAIIEYESEPAILVFVIDVSSEKTLQNQLQQAQRREEIGTLAGGIAHDFNNILSSIIGFTELAKIKAKKYNADIHEDLDEVIRAGNRATKLVKQILAYSRQEEQKLRPTCIHPIIKEVLKMLRSSIPSTIEFRENITECGAVMADATQIHQVMINLCTNAYHAMENESGILEVNLYEIYVEMADTYFDTNLFPAQYVKLTISDTGTGIEPSNLERIFDPYFTTKESGKGTGLGLSVVHGIVKSHNGAIRVYSTQGKGTTFNVYLPMIPAKEEPGPTDKGPFPTGNEWILFIDDEAPIAEVNKKLLEQLGYKVTVRTSSLEALELVKANPDRFDLIISDITMPQMPGDKLALELMKIRPNIPIILSTGYSKRINVEKAMQLGVKDFLLKPILISDMAHTIRKALNKNIM